MNRRIWLIGMGSALLLCSAVLYWTHYRIFPDQGWDTIYYTLMDIAFLPVQVFLVAVIIERAMSWHDKRAMMSKLNMVIGTFFSELGTGLLGTLTNSLRNRGALREKLNVRTDWTPRRFSDALSALRAFALEVDMDRVDLPGLRDTLVARRGLLLTLLANPNLLEHERFTDLLWAVFHLLDELTARTSLDGLPPRDRDHLAGDIRRAYGLLAAEWLLYVQHLKTAYPFIFSIMVRTHPLQDKPSAVVE